MIQPKKQKKSLRPCFWALFTLRPEFGSPPAQTRPVVFQNLPHPTHAHAYLGSGNITNEVAI